MVLAVQLFNKFKKKKKTMNLDKEFIYISHILFQNTFIVGKFVIFCMF